MYAEYLYSSEFDISFSTMVKSYGFSGTHNFCIRKDNLQERVNELKKMSNSLVGICKIEDADSDAHIHLLFEGRNLKITGQLGGSYEDNFMKFSFLADQTVTELFADVLRGFVI